MCVGARGRKVEKDEGQTAAREGRKRGSVVLPSRCQADCGEEKRKKNVERTVTGSGTGGEDGN